MYLTYNLKKSENIGRGKVLLWFKINEASLGSLSTAIVVIEFHFEEIAASYLGHVVNDEFVVEEGSLNKI